MIDTNDNNQSHKVVEVVNLRKIYPLYNKKRDKVREALSLTGKRYHRDFEALKGISFSVRKGECLGIIGLNGSGKSTLLKILTGVIQPTQGSVVTDGKVAALLELGAGFNPEYTGMENIYLNTLLLGMPREETREKIPEILEFADIGDFINQPVKIYSSGMFVRLAFAIAITVCPDILIIDEALSVGDIFFQQKCYNKIKEISDSSTVIIVSHDLNALTKLCKRLLVMHNGVLVFDGDAKDAVTEYYKIKQGSSHSSANQEEMIRISGKDYHNAFLKPAPYKYSGQMDAIIESYYYQVNDIPFGEICEKGDVLSVEMLISSSRDIGSLIVGYQVLDKYGNEVFGETSMTSGFSNTSMSEGKYSISFSFFWPEIREGDYFITLGIGEGEEVLRQVEQCWINQAIHIVNTTHGKLIYGTFNNTMNNFNIAEVNET